MRVVKISVVVLLFVVCLFFQSNSVHQSSVDKSGNHTSESVKDFSDTELLDFSNHHNINMKTLAIGLSDRDLPGVERLSFDRDDDGPRFQMQAEHSDFFEPVYLSLSDISDHAETIEQSSINDDTHIVAPFEDNAAASRRVVIVQGAEAKRLYLPIIKRVAAQYGLDPLLVIAIIEAESGFDPLAVSKVGARGLMQLMPPTAKAMGVQDSFDPEHNIKGGVKYFKKMLDRFDGDVRLALAAYNAGSRKVREYRGIPPYPATRYYIRKVCKLHKIYIRQQRYYSAENV